MVEKANYRQGAKGAELLCYVRQRWVLSTPEEEVRQAILHHLIDDRHYPRGRFSVEMLIPKASRAIRADILIHDDDGAPLLLVECKATHIPIDDKTLAQAAMYARHLACHFVWLSNGRDHHVYQIDERGSHRPIDYIPDYSQLTDHV